jgi:hypothetical protein
MLVLFSVLFLRSLDRMQGELKSATPAIPIFLPPEWTPIWRCWADMLRPKLLVGPDSGFVFLDLAGSQRHNFNGVSLSLPSLSLLLSLAS